MIGLPYGEKNYDDMLSRFHMVPERNGRTDRRTHRQICYINLATADEIFFLIVWAKLVALFASDKEGKCFCPCSSVYLLARLLKKRAWISMKCCVSTDAKGRHGVVCRLNCVIHV